MELAFPQSLRLLTGHGYAVLVPSLPKPQGGFTEPAAHVADKILEVVDAAARDPELVGRFDPARLGLFGFSFGGYTVMTAITQTHRFRAAVAIDGISDLAALWASVGLTAQIQPELGYVTNLHAGDVEATQPQLMAPPWVDVGRYIRNSPLYAANRIETPLLLIHGGQDFLPMSQSEAMYSALFRQGKDAMMVTYWGALHGVTSPGDVRDMYDRVFRFLDERLAGDGFSDGPPSGNPEPGSASVEPSLR
jgi:dipeptidyl aminopeptidase/acylaminoacyl peptidase